MKVIKEKGLKALLFIILIIELTNVRAQTQYFVSGQLTDKNKQPVPFANIVLRNIEDSSILAGTISDENGHFKLNFHETGNYLISISFIGYLPYEKKLEIKNFKPVDLGKITMYLKQNQLNEVVIREDRLKAKQHLKQTTYYINEGMRKSSGNGMDIIKKIPGIQVDMFHNISIDGSQKIKILVNGIERDAGFLNQLDSDKLDKIEINTGPGVEYESEISGVVNVVLKKDEKTGLDGHVNTNIPTNLQEVYSFPNASLNYALKRTTFYASYDGGFSYFNIKTENYRKLVPNSTEIIKTETLDQKNRSHKAYFGTDCFFDEKNQISLYGYTHRFSNEQDGNFDLFNNNDASSEKLTRFKKDEYDRNTAYFASVFYKHNFKPTSKLTFDVNYYLRNTKNNIYLRPDDHYIEVLSSSKPHVKHLTGRVKFNFLINKSLGLHSGIKQSLKLLTDELTSGFDYREKVSAAYSSINYNGLKVQFSGGIRIEYSEVNNDKSYTGKHCKVLPSVKIQYMLPGKQSLHLLYNKTLSRPAFFQLNPSVRNTDPYTTQKGNPNLQAEIERKISFNYSKVFENNFLNAGVFCTNIKNLIENLTFMEDSLMLKKEFQNTGSMNHIGIKTSGNLHIFKNVSINPYVRFYYVQTHANNISREFHIKNRETFNFEFSFSAIYLIRKDMSISASLNYHSPLTRLQSDYYEDPLYFIAVEKTFSSHLKLGVKSAVPFKKSFTYSGKSISGHNFREVSENNIQTSLFPVWITLKYSFSFGEKTNRIDRPEIFMEKRQKKGF